MSKKLMIFFPLLLLLFIFCIFSIDILATETTSKDLTVREYVFLIDTSGSMLWGEDHPRCTHPPLAQKLKEEIKNSIDDLLKDLKEEETLKLCFYTFDEGIQSKEYFSIEKRGNEVDSKDYIDGLKFEGSWTYIIRSLEVVLNDYKDIDHQVTIYLYTDGLENEGYPNTLYPNKNEEDEVTGNITNKFWEKIKSLLDDTEWKEKNRNLNIMTLEIEWTQPQEPIPGVKIVTKYIISVKPDKLLFGDLSKTGKGEQILTFSIPNTEINWNEFIEKYPDLTINATPQEFHPEILNSTVEVIISKTNGKYNLIFKIDKKKMIEDVISGDFTGKLKLSVNSKKLEEKGKSIGLIDPLPVSFGFSGPEKYHISIIPKKLDFGNLYDTAEGKATLAFSITTDSGLKVNWDKFLEKYPDLTLKIAPQRFSQEIAPYIPKSFDPVKLNSLTNGKYKLSFKINKEAMIRDVISGDFTGKLALSVKSKKLEEGEISIGLIDNYIPVSFSIVPEKYRISIIPKKLDFGDLYDTAEGKATLIFNIDTDTGLKVSWDKFLKKYPDLTANITPQGFTSNIIDYIEDFTSIKLSSIKDKEYDLTFVVDKERMIEDKKFEECKGELAFLFSEQSISITSILVHFKFFPPPEVVITLPSTGEGKIPINFGVIKEEKQYQQEIMLDFNQQAIGKELKVSLSISPDNPSELVIGENLWINGQKKKSIDIISATKEIELVLKVTPSELKYGKYYGRINFTSEDLSIKGANLEPNSTNPNQKYYEWTFKTPMPLWMIILIVAICLIVLLLIIYLIITIIRGGSISLPSLKSSKAVIPDETYLYLRDYDTGKREQINISGKEEVAIGKDGQYLSDTEERIVLRAIKEDGKNLVRLTVESGKVILIKAGSAKEEIVVEQNVYNRDIIKFGNYQIRVSGFYLERY